MIPRGPLAVVALLALLVVSPALAFDPAQTFHQGAFVISPEVGYGQQVNLEDKHVFTGLEFVNAGRPFRLAALQPGRAGTAPRILRGGARARLPAVHSLRSTRSSPAWA